jgi:hypothetical protein
MPRIYSTLDNKQAEYQSPIEVEGRIDNHPIVILIDSGANNSYINPQERHRSSTKCWFQEQHATNNTHIELHIRTTIT